MIPNISFQLIAPNSEEYEQMRQLRTTVLLQPIGIDASYIKPEDEREDLLLGAFAENTFIGCCILTRRSPEIVQLRQMAIATSVQRKGLGTSLLQFAEKVARENGYQKMLLHARSPVVPFYEKNGYEITGAPFEEVSIQHYRMTKPLG